MDESEDDGDPDSTPEQGRQPTRDGDTHPHGTLSGTTHVPVLRERLPSCLRSSPMDFAAAVCATAPRTRAQLQNSAHHHPVQHLRRDPGVKAKSPRMPGRRRRFRASCQPATSMWAMLNVFPNKDGHEQSRAMAQQASSAGG